MILTQQYSTVSSRGLYSQYKKKKQTVTHHCLFQTVLYPNTNRNAKNSYYIPHGTFP